MRQFLRNLVAGVGLALMAASAMVFPAQALTSPPTFSPRMFQTQQTHYIRTQVTFTSCVFASLTCTVKLGNVPYNAFLVRAFTQTTTTWTGATTMTLSLGTTSSAATNIMAAATILTAGNAVAQSVAGGGLGMTVTGNGVAQTGGDGGFDIYGTLTATVALPTAGQSTVILEYIAPNDGACIDYPLVGATGAC